ncbi:MAG: peptidase S9 [Candidatus Eisenbacteria bacterium]|nr:peptidase S9 [Candidatus Eisenbacteria bacterium]
MSPSPWTRLTLQISSAMTPPASGHRRSAMQPYVAEEGCARHRRAAVSVLSLVLLVSVLLAWPAPAWSQYFGRNKVRYHEFDFQVLKTEHFEVYYYPNERMAAEDMARMAERWYVRLSGVLRHDLLKRNPIILYANHAHFQQTNVIQGLISEGTGGVTEPLKDRVVLPLTGVYRNNDHVLGHELVHAFQFDVAQNPGDTLGFSIGRLPLWMVEGMAEYLSVGRNDPLTAMWMRDALLQNDFPKISDLGTDPRYFPYRFGQAFWAYVAGVWGDDIVPRLYRATGELGPDEAFRSVLGMSSDSLSALWAGASREYLLPPAEGRTAPKDAGRSILSKDSGAGEMVVGPAISPDGKRIAFLSERGFFSIDLYLADARTGKVVKRLTRTSADPHFTALRFIDSAGAWSPDGRRLAFVVFETGENRLAILDVGSEKIERQIRVKDAGGLSNPSWSPDGATIAFTTDRGDGTNFETLEFGNMRIGLMDVRSRAIRMLDPLPGSNQINPQYASDGRSLFFIADRSGIADIYRVDLGGGAVRQVTAVKTGVSGITSLSPAISVSPGTGEIVFSVFERGGYRVQGLDASEAQGGALVETNASAGILPPADLRARALVERYLADPRGLPSGNFASRDYSPALKLDAIGVPSAGIAVDRYGASVAGAIGLYFSDMLANRELSLYVQANGGVRDIGGQVIYQNNRSRWTWGAAAGHIPYRVTTTAAYQDTVRVNGQPQQGVVFEEQNQRQYEEMLQLNASYPFSQTQRFEIGTGYSRITFSNQLHVVETVSGFQVRDRTQDLPSRDAMNLFQGYAALVEDRSFFGFTSPVAGTRWRLEVAPTFGSLQYESVLADYRHYFFLRPITFAVRGLHFGRYGGNAESDDLSPLFLGTETLVRGYSSGSFDASECGDPTGGTCGPFDRLIGSRIAVGNLELRVPLLGDEQLRLLTFPYLPTEIVAFADGGVAWSSSETPKLRFDRTTNERVPVFSAGGSARLNVLGALVVELYAAHPFQRPEKNWEFGFLLSPGW